MPKRRKKASVRELDPFPETSIIRLYDALGILIHTFQKGEPFPDFCQITEDMKSSRGYVSVDMTSDAGMWSETEVDSLHYGIRFEILSNTHFDYVGSMVWGDELPKSAWQWFELNVHGDATEYSDLESSGTERPSEKC